MSIKIFNLCSRSKVADELANNLIYLVTMRKNFQYELYNKSFFVGFYEVSKHGFGY